MHLNLPIVIMLLALFYGLEGLFPYFQGREHRIRHAFPNVIMGGLNVLLTTLVFTGITVMLMVRIEEASFGLLHTFRGPAVLKGMLAFLMFDCWMYLWHRVNHRVPFLWRFHRMHHSDLEMDNTTALRFHPGEIAFSSLARLIVIPVIGLSVDQLLIYEFVLFLGILFHHSNISLPKAVDRALCAVIVTPDMHRVHHSQIRSECDSNYSTVFSFWDRMFRTFRAREDTLTIRFGVRTLVGKRWQSLRGMVLTPFRSPEDGDRV